MKCNPLIDAVNIYKQLLDAEGHIQSHYSSEEQENFNDWDKVLDLIINSWDATHQLSPRARVARLNLIWKHFLEENKQ